MDESEVAHLIGRAKDKDPDAFDRIVDLYGRRLHGYLYRLTASRDDADELLQDLFLRVVRTIGSYQHDGRFEGWLFRIATNLARDRLRRLSRRGESVPGDSAAAGFARSDHGAWEPGLDSSQPAPDQPLMIREQVDAMQKALARLPAGEREVVMLRHFSQLSFAEIAEAMGTPLGTTLARGHRGLAKLREWMTVSSADQES